MDEVEFIGGTMLQSLKTVLPIKEKENIKVKKRLRLLIDRETGEKQLHYYLEKNQKARARLMAALLDDPLLDYELVRKKLNITATVIRALEEQHVLAVESEQVYRNPVHADKLTGLRADAERAEQVAGLVIVTLVWPWRPDARGFTLSTSTRKALMSIAFWESSLMASRYL